MLFKQLDSWVRRAVYASRALGVEQSTIQEAYQGPERRQSYERRGGQERRREMRFGVEVKDRRSRVDRRSNPPQAKSIN